MGWSDSEQNGVDFEEAGGGTFIIMSPTERDTASETVGPATLCRRWGSGFGIQGSGLGVGGLGFRVEHPV